MIGTGIFNESFSEDKLNLIARGGFSQIFVTQCNLTNELIVIKKMKTDDASTLNFLSQEANCIKKLNDENPFIKNIIKIYSHCQQGNCIYIAMEYCPMGSLEKLLVQKQKLTHMEIMIFAKQMISALMYAHKLGLVHSDLKPENVLIRQQNEYVLTDWGSAQQLNHQHSTTLRDNTYFTPGYQAPELQNENLISSNMKFNYFIADIYSLGMMLLRCTGPSFREIRTISSEADQSDHDWKINKLFKSYIFQKEYQDGIIDKIIAGFLNYSKQSRMKLEEALSLINQAHPNLESYISLNSIDSHVILEEQPSIGRSQTSSEQNDESFNFSKLKISTIENPNPAVNLQYNQNSSITIPKKNNSSYRNYISSINQSLQQQQQQYQEQLQQQQQLSKQLTFLKPQQPLEQTSIKKDQLPLNQFTNTPLIFNNNNINNSNNNTPIYHQPSNNGNSNNLIHQDSSNKSNSNPFNYNFGKVNEYYKSVENMSISNASSNSSGSGSGSNQSSQKIEKNPQTIDRKDSSRQSIREIKRNKSQDKCRINKNVSISYMTELIKLTPDVDNFKAYLSNQVHDGNISYLAQKLNELVNIKKLFLAVGGHNDFTDSCIYALQNALSNKKAITEIKLDVVNSTKVSLQSINFFLKGIPSQNLESISLSLSKIVINDHDFDELVDILFSLQGLKRIAISFSQCSITEDDLDFICEEAEQSEKLDKFHLICPKQ